MLADELLNFNTRFTTEYSSRPDRLQLPAVTQAHSAWQALTACCGLSSDLPLQPAERLRLLRTGKLLFDAGRLVLSESSRRQQQMPGSDGVGASVEHIVYTQLLALDLLVGAATQLGNGSGPETFARGVAKPAVLLPWLATVTEAMQASCIGPHIEDGELAGHTMPVLLLPLLVSCAHLPVVGDCSSMYLHPGRHRTAGVGYLRCINVVLSLRGWEQHHDALLAQPGLRGAALRCLLQQVLPALAAAMEAASAAGPDWEAVQPVSTQEVSPVAFTMHGHSEYRTLPPQVRARPG